MGEWLFRRLGKPWGPWRRWLEPGAPAGWDLPTVLRVQAAEGFTHPAPLQAWDSRDRCSDGSGSIAEALRVLLGCGKLGASPAGLD